MLVNVLLQLISFAVSTHNEQLNMSARLRQKRECRLTSISVGVTITGLLGGGGSRSSGSGTFAVVVVVVEDTSGRLGWGCRNVGGSRCSGCGGSGRYGGGSCGGYSSGGGSGRCGVRVGVIRMRVPNVADTGISTSGNLEGVDI